MTSEFETDAVSATTERTGFLANRRRDAESRWHVLHTLSRQEKSLACTLAGMGVSHFLPLRRHVARHGARRAEMRLPLFPGYLFLWGSIDEAYRADRTGRVANLIRVPDQASLEWELGNLHLALTAQAPLDPYDALRSGLRARVVAGPLEGIEGRIASRTRIDRLVLQVQMLGTGVSLDVDAGLLQIIDE